MTTPLLVSLAANALLAICCGVLAIRYQVLGKVVAMFRKGRTPLAAASRGQVRDSMFAVFKVPAAPVVFMGDSLAEDGDWFELTGNAQYINRGVGGEEV
ncbi:MAG TPA: hypothetical protein VLL76_02650, partial [Candidatus Omnitrophota bacterium]|nr:hypothetical protein [Candidatus Omnitrophota bacterium]